MQLQKQPNRWSCLLVSFAMALDTPYQLLIEELGHDGGEFLWPELPEPLCRRSFHIQEMISCCINRGLFVMQIDETPVSCPSVRMRLNLIKNQLKEAIQKQAITVRGLKILLEQVNNLEEGKPIEMKENLFERYLPGNIGVLIGESIFGASHACAWDGQMIYDPAGKIYDRKDFAITTFYLIDREIKFKESNLF